MRTGASLSKNHLLWVPSSLGHLIAAPSGAAFYGLSSRLFFCSMGRLGA